MTFDEAKAITRLIHSTAMEQVGNDPAAVALDMAVAALADASVMDALLITAKVQPPKRSRNVRLISKR